MASRNSQIRRKLRRQLAKKRGNRCAFCGASNVILTLDHKIPLSKGGTWKPSNLQLLCADCNTEKADKMPWDFNVTAKQKL